MKLNRNAATVVRLLAVFAAGSSYAFAQSDPAPASAPAITAPGSLVYEAIKVQGKVRVGGPEADPHLEGGWTPLKEGDLLVAGQQVRVGLRSKLKLVARPEDSPTVLLFDRATVVQITELSLANGVATTRMDLKYGTVKGGVAEGETRSDLTIQSPGATLSKKGTDIFGFEARPDGRFNMFLTEGGRGMLQGIINQAGGVGGSRLQSRYVKPGEWITEQMARAIDNVQFDRKVQISDQFGLTNVDQLFAVLNDRGGIGFLLPPGSGNQGLFGNIGNGRTVQGNNGQGGNNQGQGAVLLNGVRNVSGGDFGIGQGTIPSVFGPARAIKRQALVNRLR